MLGESAGVDYGAATRAIAREASRSRCHQCRDCLSAQPIACETWGPAAASDEGAKINMDRPVPKSVAIVAMGASMHDYLGLAVNQGGKQTIAEEIWGIGMTGGVLQCDRIFMMNDIEDVRRILAECPERTDVKNTLDWLKTAKGPVYCSRAHPEFPATVEYPLLDVLRTLKLRRPYLNGSVAFAIGYAIHLGVESLGLFGCDFTYPDNHISEKGRACAEFWLAYHSLVKGGKIILAPNTSLLDHNVPDDERLYGFGGKIRVVAEGDEINILREPASSAAG